MIPAAHDALEIVRRQLANGNLPWDTPSIARITLGAGASCDVCEHPIVEAEYQIDAMCSGQPFLRFHHSCFQFLRWVQITQEIGETTPRSSL